MFPAAPLRFCPVFKSRISPSKTALEFPVSPGTPGSGRNTDPVSIQTLNCSDLISTLDSGLQAGRSATAALMIGFVGESPAVPGLRFGWCTGRWTGTA